MKSPLTTSLRTQAQIDRKEITYMTNDKLTITYMKNITLYITLFFSLLFWSCEEVVDIPLDTENPRLVVEASINWQKGTAGNNQIIKLTTTGDFYSSTVPKVFDASVIVKNSAGTIFNFVEIPNTGEYACSNFAPVLNETYTLEIITNGQTYRALETMKSVAPITTIEQKSVPNVSDPTIDIRSYFDDPANEENFYLFKFDNKKDIKPYYDSNSDEFTNGNESFSLHFDEDLQPGDPLDITHYGISEAYFNYMQIVISLSGSSGGGPFQSPPITAKGNVINTKNKDNYAFGYFSLSEIDKRTYIVK
jgi:hypothetical protein